MLDEQKQQLIIDYHQTFDTEAGKRVLEHMKKCARFNYAVVFRDAHGRIDELEIMRHEGMRAVIINIETHLRKENRNEYRNNTPKTTSKI